MVLIHCLILMHLFVCALCNPVKDSYKLDIIHYNDFHVRFVETSLTTPTCRTNNSLCLGGFPRLYYEIQLLLKEKPDSILLNAGDNFQGTFWFTLLHWQIDQEFLNLLPHDAFAIGNHEFDDGPEGLAPFLKGLNAPVLCANMETSEEPLLQGLYQPSVVLERKGRKIGIIGLITTDTPKLSNTTKVRFMDPIETTRTEAQKLTSEGIDIIIVLSHCGLNVDKDIAREAGENVDIIVGGHTHSLLWNGPTPSGDKVEGPYPIIVKPKNSSNHEVLIVQASSYTKFLGNLSVYFNDNGDYIKWEGGPIFLNRSIPEDQGMIEKLAPYAKMVDEAGNVLVGTSLVEMPKADCVYGECLLGDAAADSMNEEAKATYASQYEYIALIQRGDLQSDIPKGNITKLVIFELFPYNDQVLTCEMEGRYILEALERSVQDSWATNPFKGPWVLQVSGLKVVYNLKRPKGSQVVSVVVGNKELDENAVYQVTLPNFLSDGGDGYTMFAKNKKNVRVISRDYLIFKKYVTTHSPLSLKKDDRITFLN